MTTSGPHLLFFRLAICVLFATCVLFAGCLLLHPFTAHAAIKKAEITFDTIRELAARRAASAWKAPDTELPSGLAALDHDQNRKIRFIPEKALWREENLPFNLQLFHRTSAQRERITISEFSPTHVQDIPFIREFFDYGDLKNPGWLRSSLGYAGFRIHYPLNRPEVYDELLVFLGASYFRALGAGQIYGISARGLAIDTGIIGQTEEFPVFTDFWLGKPKPGAKTLTIHALLDSRSVAGACEFIVTPGKPAGPTIIDVRTELRFRTAVQLPGIAPLTSMFRFGENTDRPPGELRPEVHDSDGLLAENKNTRAWRPLSNPRHIVSTDIALDNPVRFGLLQRDRAVSSYEDFEALYHQRPSVWIEPKGDWGRGKVRLVELPAGDGEADNIVAFWVPETKPLPGRPVQYSYRMTWALSEPKAAPPLAHVAATRTGTLPGNAQGRLIWVDFAGGQLEGIEADKITAKVETSAGGKILDQTLIRHPGLKGWRVALRIERTPGLASDGTIELRCQLLNGYDPLSETWLYSWTP
ncbi:MAG: glucan biosynthesis protein [Opitutaceae bacterium]|nr:glucan biosynthesis protein [Opitutaceae bacterium]